jgi:hypothetical protein
VCLLLTGVNIKWEKFVRTETLIWFKTVKGWLLDARERAPAPKKRDPVMAVTYEDIVKDTEHELEKILKFLMVPYSTTQLRAVVTAGYDQYLRRPDTAFEHYTAQQKVYVRRLVENIQHSLKISYASLNLTSYMNP